jgi:DHA1 family multidrug resistance protein-like MFS transporter
MAMNRIQILREEGWQRTLTIMFFAQLMTAVGFSSIFPFLPLYVTELGSSTGASVELLSGLVFSAQAFSMMLASPIWGSLADRYGRKLMVVRATIGGSILLLAMAFVQNAEQLVLLRTIQGAITGTLAASNALVAAVAPRERSGYAMGLLTVALGSGVAVGPLIGGAVADLSGYNAAFFVTAGLLFLAGVLVMIGVKEDFKPVARDPQASRGVLAAWAALLRTEGLGIAYGVRFLSQLGRMMVVPITPLFVQRLMPSLEGVNTMTGLVTGAYAGMLTLSSIIMGRLGDRVGHRRVVLVSVLLVGFFYLPQSLVTETWQLLILLALAGAAMGGVMPTVSALMASYSTSAEAGRVYGLDNSVSAAARSAAPMIGSAIALWVGLRGTFIAASAIFLLTFFLALLRLPEPDEPVEIPPGQPLERQLT